MVFYPDSRIVNNCHVEQTFLVRFTAGPVYGREGVLAVTTKLPQESSTGSTATS